MGKLVLRYTAEGEAEASVPVSVTSEMVLATARSRGHTVTGGLGVVS